MRKYSKSRFPLEHHLNSTTLFLFVRTCIKALKNIYEGIREALRQFSRGIKKVIRHCIQGQKLAKEHRRKGYHRSKRNFSKGIKAIKEGCDTASCAMKLFFLSLARGLLVSYMDYMEQEP